MNFSDLVMRGVERIYREDFAGQVETLTTVCSHVREMENINSLLVAKAFFVPNNDYIKEYFGMEITNPDYDVYSWDGHCYWDNFIVFPLSNIGNQYVGFAGFDVLTKVRIQDKEITGSPTYRYSSAKVFNRSMYLFCLPGVYEKAIEDGYIVLVDGGFDMFSFSNYGINSASALGSVLTQHIIFQLLFIDTIYIALDNDDAGIRLAKELKLYHPKVRMISQGYRGDADDMIKSDVGLEYITKVRSAIAGNRDLSFRVRPMKLLSESHIKMK